MTTKTTELTLRTRIIVAAAVFGAVMGTTFAVVAYFAFDWIEESFVAQIIEEELDAFIAHNRVNGEFAAITSAHLRAYVEGTADWDALPAPLRGAAPGDGEYTQDGRGYQYEIREADGRRFVMVYDETTIEQTEIVLALAFVFGVVIVTTTAAWLGYAASKRLIEPVTRLASEVRSLDDAADKPYQPRGYADDEVGMLARTFAEHQHKMRGFFEREREFTGHASHELRTPLTVIRTAADLLADDATLTPSQRARVQRIRRGVAEMGDLVDALLLLARDEGSNLDNQTVDVRSTIEHIATDLRQQPETPTVDIIGTGRPTLTANAALLGVVLRNLMHNAARHGGGHMVAEVASDRVTIADRGPGLPTDGRARGGLGLLIVQRLCARHGWRFALESQAGLGTRATIDFGTP